MYGLAVAGVGMGHGRLRQRCVPLLIACTEGRKRAHEEQSVGHVVGLFQYVAEKAQILEVHTAEVAVVYSLGGPEVVDYIIPARAAFYFAGQSRGVVVVKHYEFQAAVGQVSARGRGTYGHGHIHAAVEPLAGDEAADEAAGTHHEKRFSAEVCVHWDYDITVCCGI